MLTARSLGKFRSIVSLLHDEDMALFSPLAAVHADENPPDRFGTFSNKTKHVGHRILSP